MTSFTEHPRTDGQLPDNMRIFELAKWLDVPAGELLRRVQIYDVGAGTVLTSIDRAVIRNVLLDYQDEAGDTGSEPDPELVDQLLAALDESERLVKHPVTAWTPSDSNWGRDDGFRPDSDGDEWVEPGDSAMRAGDVGHDEEVPWESYDPPRADEEYPGYGPQPDETHVRSAGERHRETDGDSPSESQQSAPTGEAVANEARVDRENGRSDEPVGADVDPAHDPRPLGPVTPVSFLELIERERDTESRGEGIPSVTQSAAPEPDLADMELQSTGYAWLRDRVVVTPDSRAEEGKIGKKSYLWLRDLVVGGPGAKPTSGSTPTTEDTPEAEETETIESIPKIETEPTVETEPRFETEPTFEPAPTFTTEPRFETEPTADTEPRFETEPTFETEHSVEAEPTVETRPAFQIDLTDGTKPTDEQRQKDDDRSSRARWYRVVIAAAIVLATTVLATSYAMLAPTYAAESDVVVTISGLSAEEIQRELQSLSVFAESQTVLAPVAGQFGVSVTALREMFDSANVGDSTVLRFTVTDENPELALAINDAIVASYLEVANQPIDQEELAFVQSQIAATREAISEIDSTLSQLEAQEAANNSLRLRIETERNLALAQLSALQDRLVDLRASGTAPPGSINFVQTQVNEAEARLGDLVTEAQALEETDASTQSSAGRLRSERTVLRSELANLEQLETDLELERIAGTRVGVLAPGHVVDEPVGLTPVRAVALGLLVGGALAFAWVFLSTQLRRKR